MLINNNSIGMDEEVFIINCHEQWGHKLQGHVYWHLMAELIKLLTHFSPSEFNNINAANLMLICTCFLLC